MPNYFTVLNHLLVPSDIVFFSIECLVSNMFRKHDMFKSNKNKFLFVSRSIFTFVAEVWSAIDGSWRQPIVTIRLIGKSFLQSMQELEIKWVL